VRFWHDRLSVRLVSVVLGLSLLCAVLLTGNDFRTSARNLETQIDGIGTTLVNTIAYTCGDAIATEDTQTIESYAKYALHQPDVLLRFVRIERADGKVLNMSTSPDTDDIAAANVREFRAPVLLRPENRILGHCTIWLEVEPWQVKLRDRSRSALLQNFLAFSLIASVLSLLVRVWLGRPLRHLDEAARRIASGELQTHVTPTGVGELLRLSQTLEAMRKNLRDSYASMSEQYARLRELDRLKDEFLANTSHEIRTPLSSILGGIDLLGDAEPRDQAALVDAMRRNGNHLLYLVNSVLDFSKARAGNLCLEPQAVDLHELLLDIRGCLQPQILAKQLQFRLDWSPDAPARVVTDPLRLRQILINLLGNAIKFTDVGEVVLKAARRDAASPEYELSITDTGPGVSAEMQQRLFIPFVQGDSSLSRRHGGTGLGLAISQQLAQALGGDVTLTSEIGVGTTVVLRLPIGDVPPTTVAGTAVPASDPAATDAGAAKPAARRVLLVDDAADNRRLLSTILRRSGVEVATAENGELGCRSVADANASGLPFDLVLMDIQMPVLDGHAAARRLRQEGCTIPLVALTAHATETDRETCLAAGFNAYITKPISRQQLNDLVQRYVAPVTGDAPPGR